MIFLRKNNGNWVICISFLIAFLLTAMPLPHWINDWQPVWVLMVLVYWCMALPARIGLGIGWFAGLLLDVLQGVLLGQNALALVCIVYFVIRTHKRIRMFPLVQQSCLVGFMVIFYLLMVLWIRALTGITASSWNYWLPVVSSIILWPWLFIILRNMRRYYRIA